MKIKLDQRCLDKEEYESFYKIKDKHPKIETNTSYKDVSLKMTRYEYFEKTSTLKDLIDRIKSGPIYGYFEGLEPIILSERQKFRFNYDSWKSWKNKKEVKMFKLKLGM